MSQAQQNSSNLYIGIMSGTSVDGIDVALVNVDDQGTRFIAGSETPFADDIKALILDLCRDQKTDFLTLGRLGVKLGRAYGEAVNALLAREGLKPGQIRAIGCHGQTLYHAPDGDTPFSLQWVNAAELAAITGITTVTDFRSMDIALGGQGAPLVPLFHRSLVEEQTDDASLVFLNIGGIGNVSLVHPGPLKGFDTGPGNVLLDAWIRRCHGMDYDKDGAMARRGTVHQGLLAHLLREPYFQMAPPKSTGRELFNLEWLLAQLSVFPQIVGDDDVMATLVALTAQAITDCLADQKPGRLLVCGGGARNPALMDALVERLPGWQVAETEAVGINADFMEAMAFAWLAARCLARQPGTSVDVTGARRAEIAGQITQVAGHPLALG